jgi:hypothetical protein
MVITRQRFHKRNVGKRNDEGKPLFDVIAELKTLFGLLDMYTTGIPRL